MKPPPESHRGISISAWVSLALSLLLVAIAGLGPAVLAAARPELESLGWGIIAAAAIYWAFRVGMVLGVITAILCVAAMSEIRTRSRAHLVVSVIGLVLLVAGLAGSIIPYILLHSLPTHESTPEQQNSSPSALSTPSSVLTPTAPRVSGPLPLSFRRPA